MHETVLNPGWDTFIVAVPFIGILIASFFRLDVLFAASKKHVPRRRGVCGMDEDGEPILCDPDGRPWRTAPVRKHAHVVQPLPISLYGETSQSQPALWSYPNSVQR